jgi:hypothetical protein
MGEMTANRKVSFSKCPIVYKRIGVLVVQKCRVTTAHK